MIDWSPAIRFYEATLAAARHTGLADHVPQLLIRFGLPGLMTRIGVDPPVAADGVLLRAQALYHTLLREAAQELGGELARAGVRHFFAKGIALLGPVYRPGDRFLADIDLYVPGDGRAGALDVLARLGYAPLPDRDQVGPEALRSTLALERPGSSEMEAAAVDMHWALDPVEYLLPRPDHGIPNMIWGRLRDAEGLTVPAPEVHAAILAHHLVHGDLLHVRSLLDMAFVFADLSASEGGEYLAMCAELHIRRFGVMLSHLVAADFAIDRPRTRAGEPRGWNRFTRGLTLERWLALVAEEPPGADEAITVARLRRRLRVLDGRRITVLRDALLPPREFLAWRWHSRSIWRARLHHYTGLVRKVFDI